MKIAGVTKLLNNKNENTCRFSSTSSLNTLLIRARAVASTVGTSILKFITGENNLFVIINLQSTGKRPLYRAVVSFNNGEKKEVGINGYLQKKSFFHSNIIDCYVNSPDPLNPMFKPS